MPLTPAQLNTLRTHILANTNLIGGVPINSLPNDPDANAAIADWYNGTALAGDAQPFADSLNVWLPAVTTQALNSAVVWATPPNGATTADVTNSWLAWQSMCWNNSIDLTDDQVRSGVASIWPPATNNGIKAVGVGRRAGTRFELLFAGPNKGKDGAGASGTMANNGRVSPFFGQKLTGSDVNDARAN